MYVQYDDCLWKVAVPESFCPGFNGPVLPARGGQVKQRLGAVVEDAGHSVEAA